ncbi:Autophagy protein 22 [Mortierella claussenii]|nr:Autophagy protein 22 [Mortierella claussenii]
MARQNLSSGIGGSNVGNCGNTSRETSTSPSLNVALTALRHEDNGLPVDVEVTPLRKTEVWAWYFQNATYCAYGWVSAVMMVPLLIQDIVAQGSVEASNHAIPCDTTVADYKCVKQVFGDHYLEPGTISLKTLLVMFATLGCITSLAFFAVQSPSMFWLTIILSPLGWACHNVSSVFSNAILPIYARAHPLVLEAIEQADAYRIMNEMDEQNKAAMASDGANIDNGNCYSGAGVDQLYRIGNLSHSSCATQLNNVLCAPTPTMPSVFSTAAELRKVKEQVSNDLSARCAGAANVGAVIVQGVCIGISLGMNNSYLSLQVAIAFTGVWWLTWTLAVMPFLNARPGPPLPKDRNWIAYSWSKNYKTFKSMRQLSQITKFIFAWFMLSDGVNTVIALVYVITYQDLHFSHTKSLFIALVLSTMAFVGAHIFLYLRQCWKLSTKFMILLTLGLYSIPTAYFVITSYFTTRFGLRHEWEAWAAVAYLGLVVSTFHGATRVMMAELCPEGDENEWFSLFQLADKGSSWIGPFITGAIQSITGEFRTGFWFPLALFAAGAVLLLTVNMDKGKDEAITYKQREQDKRQWLASVPTVTITFAKDD